jgi:hypothetical protein
MIVSRCHRSPVNRVDANEGVSYYECAECEIFCDTMFLNHTPMEGENVSTCARLSGQIEQVDRAR